MKLVAGLAKVQDYSGRSNEVFADMSEVLRRLTTSITKSDFVERYYGQQTL